MQKHRSLIEEYKINAKILLKASGSDNAEDRAAAIARFSVLNEPVSRFQLKHALQVIALENGYESWKTVLEREDISWYPRPSPFALNWFSDYQGALDCMKQTRGYLLSYRGQFFVATADYIDYIGLDPEAEAWKKIGFNVVEPLDKKAFKELLQVYRKKTKKT